MADKDTSVKVAVRIRPLNSIETSEESAICVDVLPGEPKIVAGSDLFFTFDYAFGLECEQEDIYSGCVVDLVNSIFEGFNATILAYGQTGSGKTWTMGSSSDLGTTAHTQGIIPRVIRHIFHVIEEKENQNANASYKVQVSFLEIYGEDIRDLLDQTKSSKVSIREAPNGDVFVAGAREEVVTSVQQMSKTLEDGTKNRTTASTRMNLASSRSHAIFTVMIEHTIHVGGIARAEPAEVTTESEPESKNHVQMKQEVRKCKFHFVDLAGSERLKRTGAQGQQMKEGIDINKGLLALGNVISALGDETKRGKVHVPYRDSKLTRILQDSLGGNSKTLMICCVSPAYSNFFESVNALRYANRARNIKNKPVINRDPTLIIIDELKCINQLLASEVVAANSEFGYIPKEPRFTIEFLGTIVGTNSTSLNPTLNPPGAFKRAQSTKQAPVSSDGGSSITNASPYGGFSSLVPKQDSSVKSIATVPRNKLQEQELKKQLDASEEEIRRMTQIMRQSHSQIQELSDRLAFTSGERDFFRMKWMDANPDTVSIDDSFSIASSPSSRRNSSSFSYHISENILPIGAGAVAPSFIKRELKKERDKTVDMISKYVKEIEDLKRDLNRKQPVAGSKALRRTVSPLIASASENVSSIITNQDFEMIEGEDVTDVDADWTASIARAIAQAKDFIKLESKKLLQQTISKGTVNSGTDSTTEESKTDDLIEDDEDEMDEAEDAEAHEIKFKRRQDDLKAEVVDITESIQVKENLVKQLEKSQHQYSAMKSFYEQKLEALSQEMAKKHSERDVLLKELNDLETKKNVTLAMKVEKESKLREELKRRDEELRGLKKKQEDLNRLSKVQSRYLEQLSKLESDIESMKRHRTELTKTLAQEKKQHLFDLKEKAKEIDILKRQLIKRAEEINRLGSEKEKAMNRAKEMMREGAELRRRSTEFYKLTNARSVPNPAVIDKKSIVKSAPLIPKRIMSQTEMKTKKWLEKQIIEINAREQAAEALRRQCEQQMALIKERELLETSRDNMMTKSISSIVNGSISNPKMDAMTNLLGKRDDEETLLDIEDRIAAVDSQLKLRTRQISVIREQLSADKDSGSGDHVAGKTIESLKTTAAQSLPAAHELIRLIFDMLVDSRRESASLQSDVDEGVKREAQLKVDLNRLEREIQVANHSREVDLMRVAQEYEEKLQGLFDHSSIGQMLLQEGASVPPGGKKLSEDELIEKLHQASSPGKLESQNIAVKGTVGSASNTSTSANETQLRALISLSLQQIESLRNQIAHERDRSEDLQGNVSSLDQYRSQLLRMIDDRDANIKFLEEERNFFKDMVYDLRANVEKLGGKTGKKIIRHIRHRAKSKKVYSRGGNEVVLGVSDDEDDSNSLVPFSTLSDGDSNDFDNEDSKSVVDQYEEIDFEIKNSKSVHMKGGNVVERLTNPSNFTGVHKKVFEEDVTTKRKKVQELRNHVGNSVPAFNAASAGGIGAVPQGVLSNRQQSYSVKKSVSINHPFELSGGSNPSDLSVISDGVTSPGRPMKGFNSPLKRGSATPSMGTITADSAASNKARRSSGGTILSRVSGDLGQLSVKNIRKLSRSGATLNGKADDLASETSSVVSKEDINVSVKDIDDERSSMETMPDDVGSTIRQ